MNKKLLFYLGFFALLVLAFWAMLAKYTDTFNQSYLPKRGNVQVFSFFNQEGVSFSNDDIKGKVCVVEYFFTTCPSVCPRMNNNMKKIYEAYKDEPIVVVDIFKNKRYHIKYLNVYTVQNTNMLSWVDKDDITLDIEYYRNEKLNKILE